MPGGLLEAALKLVPVTDDIGVLLAFIGDQLHEHWGGPVLVNPSLWLVEERCERAARHRQRALKSTDAVADALIECSLELFDADLRADDAGTLDTVRRVAAMVASLPYLDNPVPAEDATAPSPCAPRALPTRTPPCAP
ncbi:hypothetical protein [Streptomyces sp. MJM8645]|uniref:hypothetical protein n=1 Tax=Streptomycetaceae TaxID=2062 RepID=UPI0007AF6B3E|nr:hypothetical protein [Streptomyces sp. MJM8645]